MAADAPAAVWRRGAIARANGGAEPTQPGWAALLLPWMGATGRLLVRLELARYDLLFPGGPI